MLPADALRRRGDRRKLFIDIDGDHLRSFIALRVRGAQSRATYIASEKATPLPESELARRY